VSRGGYIVSLLWMKNASVLLGLAARGFQAFATLPELMRPEVVAELAKAGAELRDLTLRAPSERAQMLERETARRMALIGPHLEDAVEPPGRFVGSSPRGKVAGFIRATLRARLGEGINFVDGLQRFHEREGIAALLLNETETHKGETAALWAEQAGIPRFLLTHGANVAPHATVSGKAHAEWVLTFGDRAFGSFFDDGIAPEKLIATGNPGWDYFREFPPPGQRSQYRLRLVETYGLRERPTVVYATTWRAKLTALEDSRRISDPIVCFLKACAILRSEGCEFNVCIKSRLSSEPTDGGSIERLAHSFGISDCCLLGPADDLATIMLGCDVLVASDSNASIEAGLLGVPTVNIWGLSSWLQGPSFAADDGIAQVRYDQPSVLAGHLRALLFDERAHAAAVSEARERVGEVNVVGDRMASDRVADFIAWRLSLDAKSVVARRRFVWHELSSPLEPQAKGSTHEYYDNPRHDLIGLLLREPRKVLDVGCGGGATGEEIKRRYPAAEVIGVELNPRAAAWAAKRMDRVINASVETLDWAGEGIEPHSIDTVLFPDVLEHLRDPWNTLVRIKPFLAADAHVFASIPNIRNLWLLTQLIRGSFAYEQEGLLDVTHIRFFTLREVQRLFSETGYHVDFIGSLIDGRCADLDTSFEGTTTIDREWFALSEMTSTDVRELKTMQFLVRATPLS